MRSNGPARCIVLWVMTFAVGDTVLAGGNNGTDCWNPGEPLVGPDLIVGDINDVSNYLSEGGIEAYAIGPTVCNIGSHDAVWLDNTDQVPLAGQNMFRLKQDRFEQIGQAWLYQEFTALTQNGCGCGCNGHGGAVLGAGCSEPHCCGGLGQQLPLGPKWQVNAFSGEYVYPPANPPFSGSVARRLQVKISDLDAVENGGGLYFVEAQYVTPDDAAAGNGENNASYRRINIAQGTWHASIAGSTQRGSPAIRAWQDHDPEVTETDVQIPGEGLLILAAKATDLGDGYWHYEYAVQNLNSDRSVGSFSVPVGPEAGVRNLGFHDVDYHSGEPFDGTDWPAIRDQRSITWATVPYDAYNNANALRWGTLYNFRFDADVPPAATEVTLGLYKPGTPAAVQASTVGPGGPRAPAVSRRGLVLVAVLLTFVAWMAIGGKGEVWRERE